MGDSSATLAIRSEDEDWEDEVLVEKTGRNEGLSTWRMVLLTICLTGVQFTWTVELAYGTPYLTSLNLPRSLTALVWLAGPLSGLLIQPIVGVYSDRCTFRIGRRRPFMLVGGALVLISIGMIAYSREIAQTLIGSGVDSIGSIQTVTILTAVVGFYFLDFSINAVQASCRSLIVDIAPIHQQETANAWGGRMIGFGNVIGYFMGFLDLPKYFPFLGNTQMKVLCWLAGLWFSASLGLTCWTIKEKRFAPDERQKGRAWYTPLMDIFRALKSLPTPIQSICNVQFFAWLGVFPFLFYSTTWVGEKALASHVGNMDSSDDMEGTRAGSFAMLLFAIISLATGFLLPLITVRGGEETADEEQGITSDYCGPLRRVWTRMLALPPVWAMSMWLFAALMFITALVKTLGAAIAVIAAVGISWGIMQWVPFTLLGECINYYAANGEEGDVPVARSGYANLPEDEEDETMFGAPISPSRPTSRNFHLDAGMVLGIHNIYIVLPQFLSTFLCSVVFAIIGYIAKQEGRSSDGDRQHVDPYDAVGWVLRIGAISSLIAGSMALKVREVHRNRGGENVVIVSGRH